MCFFLSAFKSARYRPARSDDALPHSVGALQKTVSMPAGFDCISLIVFSYK